MLPIAVLLADSISCRHDWKQFDIDGDGEHAHDFDADGELRHRGLKLC